MHVGSQSGGLNVSQQQQLLQLLEAQQTMLAQFGFNSLLGQSRPTTPPGFQSGQQSTQQAFSPQQQALLSGTVQGSTPANGQATLLPQAFNTMTLRDPTDANWNMDTGASSHLNSNATNLSTLFNSCMYPSVLVGDGKSIPVTNMGHSTLPTPYRPLHLNNVLITPNIVKNLISVRQFVRDNKCTIEFDEFGFSYWTHQILLRCDSAGDLYPVTSLSYPQAFLVDHFSHYLWVYPLRNKSDALSKFIHFRAFVKNQFQCDIKSLQCDHGAFLQSIIALLHAEFSMTNLGPLEDYFFGISVTRNTLGIKLSADAIFVPPHLSLVAYYDADWVGAPLTSVIPRLLRFFIRPTIYFNGLQEAKLPFLAPVLKLSIGVLLNGVADD
ncbi:hypothetical protein Tco_1476513 [Tanacetum coccineum]